MDEMPLPLHCMLCGKEISFPTGWATGGFCDSCYRVDSRTRRAYADGYANWLWAWGQIKYARINPEVSEITLRKGGC